MKLLAFRKICMLQTVFSCWVISSTLLYDRHVNATGKNFVTNVYCFYLVHLQFNNCNSQLLQKLHENNKQKGSTINNE